MEEEGIVVEVKGGKALVRLVESGACEGCAAAGSCKVGSGQRLLEAENTAGATPGQRVMLRVEGGAFLKASFLVYIVPVIFLFLGAALGGMLAEAIPGVMPVDFWQAASGILSLLLSIFVIRLYGKMAKKTSGLRPVVLKVIDGCVRTR